LTFSSCGTLQGLSKGFGFAQFPSIEHAKFFVEPFFPFVQIPPPASHGAGAAAAFYKALETGGPHNGRRVKIDFSLSANPADRAKTRASTNDGTRDIGNAPSPVLLFRGLDPLSGPGAITQAMYNSGGPGKQAGKGMRRIILIKDKVTMTSWGFAFVEFVDIQVRATHPCGPTLLIVFQSASAVFASTMSAQLHPNGFQISEKPVAVSFAQLYSFQPVDPMHRDEACLKSTSVLGGSDHGWVRYWDPASSVAVAEFQVETPASATESKEKEKKKKKGKAFLQVPQIHSNT
jgi:RNA-binding protein 5/10